MLKKREYFEDLQKINPPFLYFNCFYINPFLLKSEGILDSYDLDL